MMLYQDFFWSSISFKTVEKTYFKKIKKKRVKFSFLFKHLFAPKKKKQKQKQTITSNQLSCDTSYIIRSVTCIALI